jgi:hypothetical protein
MTETNAALLAGLPDDMRDLLASPPLTNTRLLELAARWEDLAPGTSSVIVSTSPAPGGASKAPRPS